MSMKGLNARWAELELDGADDRLKVLDQGVKWIMGITITITRARVAISIMEWAIMVWHAQISKCSD